MSTLKTQVLVLNQNYEPMTITDAKKAIILIYLGKAELVEKHDSLLVRSVTVALPMPSIVRLTRYISVPRKRIVLSRKNIVKRDGHRCQYCGTTHGPITVDHVIPKGRGGKDTWENLVCACTRCNNKKGNRTPEEANMTLARRPQKPSHIFFIRYFIGKLDNRWKPYLFMN
ncbi:MAG: HNH endonuclease [candidate division KSB1 bacterium]|jgi:5-methylcytosine-specific restriction endonuclease McrA|nr:HNH endonuclease [candidate division KSB1 bacterium]